MLSLILILHFPGSLPGDFETTDNPGDDFNNGFNTGGGNGDNGLTFDEKPNGFDNFPGFGGNDITDNNIDTGADNNNDVNCDYLGTCYDGES